MAGRVVSRTDEQGRMGWDSSRKLINIEGLSATAGDMQRTCYDLGDTRLQSPVLSCTLYSFQQRAVLDSL